MKKILGIVLVITLGVVFCFSGVSRHKASAAEAMSLPLQDKIATNTFGTINTITYTATAYRGFLTKPSATNVKGFIYPGDKLVYDARASWKQDGNHKNYQIGIFVLETINFNSQLQPSVQTPKKVCTGETCDIKYEIKVSDVGSKSMENGYEGEIEVQIGWRTDDTQEWSFDWNARSKNIIEVQAKPVAPKWEVGLYDTQVKAGEIVVQKLDLSYQMSWERTELNVTFSDLPQGMHADGLLLSGAPTKVGEYKITCTATIKDVGEDVTVATIDVLPDDATTMHIEPSKTESAMVGQTIEYDVSYYDRYENLTSPKGNVWASSNGKDDKIEYKNGKIFITFNTCSKNEDDRKITIYNDSVGGSGIFYIYTVYGSPKIIGDISDPLEIKLPEKIIDKGYVYPLPLEIDGYPYSSYSSQVKYYCDDLPTGLSFKSIDDTLALSFTSNYKTFDTFINLTCYVSNQWTNQQNISDSTINFSMNTSCDKNVLNLNINNSSKKDFERVLGTSSTQINDGDINYQLTYNNQERNDITVYFKSSENSDICKAEENALGLCDAPVFEMKTVGVRTIYAFVSFNKLESYSQIQINYFGAPQVSDQTVTGTKGTKFTYALPVDAYPSSPITYNCNNLPQGVSINDKSIMTVNISIAGTYNAKCSAINSFGNSNSFDITWKINKTSDVSIVKDVSSSNPHINNIIWAYQNGITSGCNSQNYCPSATVNRGAMAQFIRRTFLMPNDEKSDNPFKDIDSLDKQRKSDILWNYHKGVMLGVSSGKFAPSNIVTRANMLGFFYRAAGSPSVKTDSTFSDISSLSTAEKNAIAWGYKQGITTGCSKGKFCPKQAVKRDQMATFMRRFWDFLR